MPRRRVVERREPAPDPVYSSSLISRFINNLMHEGKKSTAERMFYGSLTIVEDKLKQDGLSVLKLALNNGISGSLMAPSAWSTRPGFTGNR